MGIRTWQQHSVYFGSTVVSVCRGMTTRQVAAFFARGILCVRAYDPSTGPHQHLKSIWPRRCTFFPLLQVSVLRQSWYEKALPLLSMLCSAPDSLAAWVPYEDDLSDCLLEPNLGDLASESLHPYWCSWSTFKFPDCTGAPHDLPAWARPGNGAAKPSPGPPRKRQKTAVLLVAAPQLAALPPPATYQQSHVSTIRQPKLPGKMFARRPYKKRQPGSAASLQAHRAPQALSLGLSAEVIYLSSHC